MFSSAFFVTNIKTRTNKFCSSETQSSQQYQIQNIFTIKKNMKGKKKKNWKQWYCTVLLQNLVTFKRIQKWKPIPLLYLASWLNHLIDTLRKIQLKTNSILAPKDYCQSQNQLSLLSSHFQINLLRQFIRICFCVKLRDNFQQLSLAPGIYSLGQPYSFSAFIC